jgi:hypothetical protein
MVSADERTWGSKVRLGMVDFEERRTFAEAFPAQNSRGSHFQCLKKFENCELVEVN